MSQFTKTKLLGGFSSSEDQEEDLDSWGSRWANALLILDPVVFVDPPALKPSAGLPQLGDE